MTTSANMICSSNVSREEVLQQFQKVQQETDKLCHPLKIEDYMLQTSPEVSPPKWHLAHMTWFYETYLLLPFLENYQSLYLEHRYLFNDHYIQAGKKFSSAHQSLLSRPTIEDISHYRQYVHQHMVQLIETADEQSWQEINFRLLMGIHHEYQHQELFLADLKYSFYLNPFYPVYREDLASSPKRQAPLIHWLEYSSGLDNIGFSGEGFAFDNECPQHEVYVNFFCLASRLVTNAEYLEFMETGGYERSELWLSDGWEMITKHHYNRPLYWEKIEGQWHYMTFKGIQPINMGEPVSHISYYEASAFASWAGKRLPTEVEWELAARDLIIAGNFKEQDLLHPAVAKDNEDLLQMYGDVWEWTRSPYMPYPGHHTPDTPFGEYNTKFMTNQMVLRGGACLTSIETIRSSFRNFKYLHERKSFSGFRLAEDI